MTHGLPPRQPPSWAELAAAALSAEIEGWCVCQRRCTVRAGQHRWPAGAARCAAAGWVYEPACGLRPGARRIVAEWTELDDEARAITARVEAAARAREDAGDGGEGGEAAAEGGEAAAVGMAGDKGDL